MKFDVVTIFPEFFAGPFHYGIVRRAREAGLIDIRVHDLRQFTHDRHKTVDDRPFGGGEGMVFKPEPMFEAVETILSDAAPRNPEAGDSPKPPDSTAVVLLSASGKIFVQEMAERFATLERMVLLCGRYEGVDERVAEHLATDEVSIGDFVLSGGELAAAMVIDAVTRLLPGALGNEASSLHESFSSSSSSSSLSPSRSPAARVIAIEPSLNPKSRTATLTIGRMTARARRSIILTTRGPRISAATVFPRCCSAEITKRFAAGASASRWKRPAAIGPTCSRQQSELPAGLTAMSHKLRI